ncbi:hypothetical protein RND81_06G026000 [Saponaria officinalis]|uniref:DNA mismatch repair protein MLH3 n=1 Tax=Saponaria officinalis TaxID=3572 RepID=A0AAW1K8Y3_SAPOF
MASIKPLSEAVLSTVRSGYVISSLATVVEELVYNSLDASARKVTVVVGVNNGYIKVEDDGSGINRDGLMLLGERYATSKGHQVNKEDDCVGTFGFRGEVLCSIADISLIDIATKIQGSPNGYRKVMKGRKCLYLSIDDKQDVGTTVVVRDLFYNQPVRRRQLQSSAKKVLHLVRECVMRIALVLPKVAFRVVDMESEDELLRTHACPTPLSLLCSNFGIESASLCKLSCSEGLLKLTGYVSSPSSLLSSKAFQYIYVNSRFVVKGPMHKALACLADMCWDRFRLDKGGKRTQSHAGPSYFLNLTCPRTSYDLNLEVSGTSVEFKHFEVMDALALKSSSLGLLTDWAPVIRFIEKSAALFWSKKKRKGDSSYCEPDEIQTHGIENVVEDLSSSKKGWQLKSCETTTKRRMTTQNYKASSEDSLYWMEMQAEDRSSSSLWDRSSGQFEKSLDNTIQLTEPDTVMEYPLCGDSAGDIRDCLRLDKTHVESDMGLRKRDDSCAETNLSHIGWKDGMQDELGDRSDDDGSGFIQDHDRNEDNYRHRALFLRSPPWDHSHHAPKSPLNCGRLSRIQIDNFEATGWESTGREDVDGLGQDPYVSQMACRRRDVANTWLLPRLDTESHLWKELDRHSLPSCIGSSDRQPRHPSEEVSEYTSLGFPLNYNQRSAIPYPFVNINEWDLDHLAKDKGAQRTSELGESYSFDLSDDEQEDFCQNVLGDRCMNKYSSPVSFLNCKLAVGSGYAGVDADVVRSFDDMSSIGYGSLLARETNSSPSDIGPRNSSSYWSPSETINRVVQMDLQRCQTLGQHDILGGRSPTRPHRRSPDSPFFASGDDILTAVTIPSNFDLRSKFDLYEPSGQDVSSTFVRDGLRTDLVGCQPFETDHIPSARFKKSIVRTRSHSAPPIYLGKRRFLSVERAMLKHSCGRPTLCDEDHHDDDTNTVEDPRLYIDIKGDPIISQDNTWSQHVKAGDSESLKEVQDLESSIVKWREGCQDTALKRISNSQSVGDSMDGYKDESRILDVQSCMLYLAGDALVPKSINRNCLERAKVLLQVDSKFIPVVGRGILAVIDQHAADERIRLEEMRQKVLSGELTSITYLEEEKELVLPEIGYQLLCNYAESIQRWGWMCNIFCLDSGSFSKNLNLLNGQASHVRLLAVPCILGVKLSDTDLLEYLEQLADTDGSSTIPPSVVRVLNYKACRGAIMFGDKLLPSECALIVQELKRTSLCFQCAHGRPTTVPLVNLDVLHKWIVQLGSSRDGPKLTWHGLRRNAINLERAKHRLDVARGS